MKPKKATAARALTTLLLVCALFTSLAVPSNAMTPAAQVLGIRMPSTGGSTSSGGAATIDYSNVSEGYVMVCYSGGASRAKVQITKSGGTTYTYDLNTSGRYETFSLTAGNGSYTINVFENVYGNQYAMAAGTTVDVSISNDTLPFLYPSQYVNFTAESATVKKAAELAAGASSKINVVKNVYAFVIGNVTYDNAKAAAISSGQMTGYLPNVDSVLSSKKGICFDYAALMAAMLRSQDIPTRLQVGYVSGGVYHAWISVWTPETGWINDMIYFDGTNWKLMDPTFASSSGQSAEVMSFIGDGKNYSVSYVY